MSPNDSNLTNAAKLRTFVITEFIPCDLFEQTEIG